MTRPRQTVLIMTDTQRTDMLGCYGNRDMQTPNLDRLASEGIRFDRAYTCQPVCGPARSALFTGTYPHTNGSWGNNMPIGQNIPSVGQRLQNQDIRTAYIGKWHLDATDYFGAGTCPEGWDPDSWYDMRNYLEELPEAERQRSRDPEMAAENEVKHEFTFAHRCSNRAIEFIKTHRHEDFFLVVSYDEPHHPWLCPPPYNTMYNDYAWNPGPNLHDALEDKPEHQRIWANGMQERSKENVEVCNSLFLGCNSFVDSEIGRVLAAIDTGIPEALVIYTADHGDALGSHALTSKGPAMYDEITRIPFIVRWPGTAPAKTSSAQPVSHIDIVPSILDAFDIASPPILEGNSLLPLFENPAASVNDVVFIEFGRYEVDHDLFGGFQPIRCATDGRHKLVINLLTSDEFYDLENDPCEMDNLIESRDHASPRDRLHDRLLDWMNETRDPFRGYYWERRPWRTDARPATWDYTGQTRQRPADPAFEKPVLDYDTGMPKTPQL